MRCHSRKITRVNNKIIITEFYSAARMLVYWYCACWLSVMAYRLTCDKINCDEKNTYWVNILYPFIEVVIGFYDNFFYLDHLLCKNAIT